ncbi:MAG: F0F1 ATP synthase subunit B [Coriobacteriia bacterium]|nr:F0F1 ATP synthase subunit B [Coriobacteriia bacterium]
MKVIYEARKKLAGVAMMAGCLLFANPVAAFAAEAAEEHAPDGGAGGLSLLMPNMLEFIPMLIGFIILWIVLAKFGWPVITGMLDRRIANIKDSLEQAENSKIESERILEEYKAELADAKRQATQIITEAKQTADVIKADITAKAQAEAESMIVKARIAIDAEKKAAIADLQGSVADLSVSVAGRVIGQDLTDVEHRKIIERYLAEAGAFNVN